MQVFQHQQVAEQQRGVNHRVGTFRFRDMGQGRPGDASNFYLRIVASRGDFFSPRHQHNFDQVRIQLTGRFSFDRDGAMKVGTVGYFPEGTPYGPQTSAEDTVQVVLQIGGPSGDGYLSETERQRAVDTLAATGRFESGRYFAPGDARPKGIDGFQAAWEHVQQRSMRYPPMRFERPLLLHPDSFAWVDAPNAPGVQRKTLWDFGARTVGCTLWKLAGGAQLPARGASSWMVQAGSLTLQAAESSASPMVSLAPLDAFHLESGETGVLVAAGDSTIFEFTHPVFPRLATEATSAPQSEASLA